MLKHFQERSMKYEFIKNHECLFPIETMCVVLEVGSSGYFKWKSKPISSRLLLKEKIIYQISSIYFASKQRYRSARITFELNVLGYKISRITVAKYMKELGLRSTLSKKFKVTTNSTQIFGGGKCVEQEFYAEQCIPNLGI
ncbi:hypothetical protein EIB73_13530 [Kaistella carnis]|uniref:HTH-like domain-containing protein n=2 Tax=Kaistella carnis TaxID=1241979 RepID=A0A3G8XL95_9FLAO|nr:hypothetical protein EIB73_13530 [Kaistella carnis]